MKAIGIIALYCTTFSTGLVQQQHHHQHQHEHQKVAPSAAPVSSSEKGASSRRTFGIVASASLSSLAIGGPSAFTARADIISALNAPIGSPDLLKEALNNPFGSGAAIPPKATIQRAKDWTAPPKIYSELGVTRINVPGDESILPLPTSLPFANRDTLYPPIFNGEWDILVKLQQKIFPFGPDFVPSKSLLDGSPRSRAEKVGDSTLYEARYTPVTFNGDIFAVADRAFNLVSMSRSYDKQQEYPVVADSVLWDSKKNKLVFRNEPTGEASPILRTEVLVTSRRTEDRTRTMQPESRVFAYVERSKVVATTTPSGTTEEDQEIVTEFRPIDRDTILAVSRLAVYLTPDQGILWSKSKGKAVAFYDYEVLMQRQKT